MKLHKFSAFQKTSKFQIIRASDPTEKLEFTYDRDLQKLVIRKPAVSTGQSFQINLQFWDSLRGYRNRVGDSYFNYFCLP